MANKRHKPEEIVQKLRQVDVLVVQGVQRMGAIREVSITDLNRTANSYLMPPCPSDGPVKAAKTVPPSPVETAKPAQDIPSSD